MDKKHSRYNGTVKKAKGEATVVDITLAKLQKSPEYRALKAIADEYESSLVAQKMNAYLKLSDEDRKKISPMLTLEERQYALYGMRKNSLALKMECHAYEEANGFKMIDLL